MIYPYALKQGAWVPGAFTPEFAQIFATKKLDTSFQVTRFQMIFWKKRQSVTVVTVVTVFSGGVLAHFPTFNL